MKKIISMLLVVVMMFSLAMPAMAVEITGDTSKNVTATYNPVITIGDIVLSEYNGNGSVTVDEENQIYYVTVPAGEVQVVITVTVEGKNLDKVPDDGSYKVAWSDYYASSMKSSYYSASSGKLTWISNVQYYDVGTRALQYTTDGGETYIDTGWTVVIQQAYNITVNETENGTVTAPETAAAGQTVTLNVTPDEGYELNTLTVMQGETAVKVTGNTFTMPAGDVTVSATFKESVKYYDVTVEASENGSVSADKETAAPGETVTLTVTPNEHYELDTLTVNDGAVDVAAGENGTYTFAMPEGEAAVKATFKKIKYTITIDKNIVNGTVTADKKTAAPGETVTLTVEAADKYELESLTVSDGEGIAVTVNADNTFTMPAGAVTVTAAFKKVPVTSVEISWGSMDFTYTDEKGWETDGSADAGTVKVTNTGDNYIGASVAYVQDEAYPEIKGSFDLGKASLFAGESYRFTLTLSGTPDKVIPAGTKIGTVKITLDTVYSGE